ncbi:MAG: DUF4338 domain-containing protein, partial [Woeseiaceae bacterium]|nr:DUF4338 domain-containing protein [Woeseiaceae bacterium]
MIENFRWYHRSRHLWFLWQEPPVTLWPKNARGLHLSSLAVLVHFLSFYQKLLGPRSVGAYLKYLVFSNDRMVAATGWSSAVWKLAARDDAV